MKISLAILVVGLIFFGYLFEARATSPVYEWCEWSSDNTTLLHCASPTYWDKWLNTEKWQEWEQWEMENWGN